jgi:hypothetical protein
MQRVPLRPTVALAVGAALVAGQWLGRTSGSTRAERRRRLPGDDLVDHPTVVTNHAVTIAAPPDRVWPWLVQMGWHRAGWYIPRWVDRLLFPANWTSATRLLRELQRPLRVRGRTRPWWLTAAYVAALVPADHVMAAGMLAGIRRRVTPVSGWGPGGRPGS